MPKKRKPYIAIELEVFDDVPAMAQDLGLTEDRCGWQLMKLWRRCWQQRTAIISAKVVEAFLPGALEVLQAFDYLERDPDGQVGMVRIRGLERYMRIKAAQVAAAQKTNAITGAVTAPVTDEGAPNDAITGTVSDPVTGTPIVGKIEDRRSKIDQKDLPLDVQKTPEKRKRQASKWEALFAELQESRVARLRELGMPDSPEVLPGAMVNTLLAKVDETLRELAGEAYVSPEADIPPVWEAFLEGNEWARGLDPGYPLQAFASPRQLMKARKDYELQLEASSQGRTA